MTEHRVELVEFLHLHAQTIGVPADAFGELVAVYDYDLLVAEYANMAKLEGSDDAEAMQNALEHVDFNTLGILPNIKHRCPVIVREDSEDPDESGERYVFHGISYVRIA